MFEPKGKAEKNYYTFKFIHSLRDSTTIGVPTIAQALYSGVGVQRAMVRRQTSRQSHSNYEKGWLHICPTNGLREATSSSRRKDE